MKELTLGTLLAVFEEIFGLWLFWSLVFAAALITVAYVYAVIRDRHISMRKFLLAQLSMPLGAVGAVLFVQIMTDSHLRDLGGPVDWIVLAGVAMLGAVGLAILVYTVQSLFRPPARL